MTAAIPGHGYRLQFTPGCRCGWVGEPVFGPDQAIVQFENHKHLLRRKLGIPLPGLSPPPSGRPTPAERRRMQPDPNAENLTGPPKLTIVKGGA